MPYKNRDKQRQAVKVASRRYRIRNRKQLLELKHEIEALELALYES